MMFDRGQLKGGPARDLTFAGRQEITLLDGIDQFSAHPCSNPRINVYLAGAYADSVAVSEIDSTRVADLFGQFVVIRHDLGEHRLTVLTDRFGLFPLYSTRFKGRLYLATSIGAFVERGLTEGEIDFAALSDILAFNVPLDRRSPLRGVDSFPPGSEVTIDLDSGNARTRRLWNPVELLRNADVSFSDAKDRLIGLFQEGVARAIGDRQSVAITLSGGADSRCLLAASLRADRQITTYSTGVPGSRAEAYAERMAALVGVPHRSHPLDEAFLANFPALLQESILSTEGMSFSSEVEASWLRRHVVPEGVLLHGVFAELFKIGKMHSFHYDSDIGRLSGGALTERLWKRFSARYRLRREAFCSEYRDMLGELAREHIGDRVARYQAELDTAGVLQMLYIDEFLAKVAKCSLQLWNRRIPTRFPFSYPLLVDTILRVRAEDKVSNRFAAQLLKRTNATLARFPDSNTGAPIGASRVRRETIHVFDWIRKTLLHSRARADHQDFANWLCRVNPSLELVFSAIQSSTKAFDAGSVERLIAGCQSGDDASARALHFCWGWGIWQSGFLRSDSRRHYRSYDRDSAIVEPDREQDSGGPTHA